MVVLMMARTIDPMTMMTTWTVSVQMTAVNPPAMVKMQAMARRIITAGYNPIPFIETLMKIAPANLGCAWKFLNCSNRIAWRRTNRRNQCRNQYKRRKLFSGIRVRKFGIVSPDLKFDEDFKSDIGESQLLLVLPL